MVIKEKFIIRLEKKFKSIVKSKINDLRRCHILFSGSINMIYMCDMRSPGFECE